MIIEYLELSTAIQNLTQLSVTSTSSVIQWFRPVLVPAHGTLHSYIVQVYDDDNTLLVESNTVYTSYYITDILSPYSNYSVEVYANTSAGLNPSASLQIQTTQDG